MVSKLFPTDGIFAPARVLRWVSSLALVVVVCVTLTACDKKEEQKAEVPPSDVDPSLIFPPQQPEDPIATLKPGEMYVVPDRIDFGDVKVGRTVEKTVTVGNRGQKTLEIINVITAGTTSGLRVDNKCDPQLKLRSTTNCEIQLIYSPEPGSDINDATIVITHNGENTPTEIKIRGRAAEEVAVKPVEVQKIVYVTPPAASDALDQALRLQRARKAAGLGEVNAGNSDAFTPLTLYNQDPHYGYLGFDFNLSSYPVDRSRMITADRYIPAVLENTINSEIGEGRVVGVVESHVYSGDGRNILLPAGTRTIGLYERLEVNSSRLDVNWYRIIRPDGVGVAIEEPSVDVMGRRGLIGDVDRRFWERYGVPLLVSTLSSATDYLLADDNNTVTTFSDGTVAETKTETDQVVDDFTQDVSRITQNLIAEGANVRPVVTIPGGTRFNITPTRDIYFKRPTLIADVNSIPNAEVGFADLPPALVNNAQGDGTRADNPNADQTNPNAPPGAQARPQQNLNQNQNNNANNSR